MKSALDYCGGWDLGDRVLTLAEDLGACDVCTVCDRITDLQDFAVDRNKPGGRKSYCRRCNAGWMRERRDRGRVRDYRGRLSLDEGPAYLYRARDAEGRLLYVGETRNLYLRFFWPNKGHADTSEWFPLAETMDVEVYETKRDALTAEAVAIEEESPPFNNRRGAERGPRRSPVLAYSGVLRDSCDLGLA